MDEATAYMDYGPWSQTVPGGSGGVAVVVVGEVGVRARTGDIPTPRTVALRILAGAERYVR